MKAESEFILKESEMKQLAQKLWSEISQKHQIGIIALIGDLGSGKTTFTQKLISQMGISPKKIKSPTFTCIREYEIAKPPNSQMPHKIYHIDLYRITPDDFIIEEIEELIAKPLNLIIIEWADKILGKLSCPRIEIKFQHHSPQKRKIKILFK